jgi:hypothetical protein
MISCHRIEQFGGGAKTGKVLTVFSTEPKLALYGQVLASEVRVTCVPKDDDFTNEYFAWLPTLNWEPE